MKDLSTVEVSWVWEDVCKDFKYLNQYNIYLGIFKERRYNLAR